MLSISVSCSLFPAGLLGEDVKLIPKSLSIRQVVLTEPKQGSVQGAWVSESHSFWVVGVRGAQA